MPDIFASLLKYIVAALAASTQLLDHFVDQSDDLPSGSELTDPLLSTNSAANPSTNSATNSASSIHSNVTYVESVWYPTLDYGSPIAEQKWINETFGNSWGKDVVKAYIPPKEAFNKVKLYIQFDTFGRQYDRLAHLYLDGVEIWRPSTPEPGNKTVSGNFTKDVSDLLPLFQKPGNITFQLYNLVDKELTGTFDTTIIAEFYLVEGAVEHREVGWYSDKPPTDVQALGPLLASVPSDEKLTISQLSRNTTRAIVQVYASGNADEEFWYASTLSDSQGGPTRLVEVWINDQLAGYAAPFPVIYTGGFQPHLWSPLVGLHTYDVPNYHVDVTPFLPELWEGDSSIRIHVANGLNSNEPRHEWLINLALLTWQEPGIEGTGTRLPQVFKRNPSIVQIPKVQVVKTKTILRTQASLNFNGKKVFVQWNQASTQSNVQVEKADKLVVVYGSTGSDWFHYEPVDEFRGQNWTRGFDDHLVVVDSSKSIQIVASESVNISTPVGQFYSYGLGNNTWGGDQNRTVAYVKAVGATTDFSHKVIAENHTIVLDEYDVDVDGSDASSLDVSGLPSLDDLAEIHRWLTELDLPIHDSFDSPLTIETFKSDGFLGCKPTRARLD